MSAVYRNKKNNNRAPNKRDDNEEWETAPAIHFTEDKIAIRKIYVGNIPPKATTDKIRDYFKRFGEVASISIHKGSGKNFRYSFVTFHDAVSASRALNKKFHYIYSTYIKVKPADTWNQPDFVQMENPKDLKETHEDTENTPTDVPENAIQMLNDDCLLHIFTYLNIRDRVSLSLVCPRFYEVTKMMFKSYKTLDFKDLGVCTLLQARDVLNKVGKHVTTVNFCGLDVYITRKRCIEFLPRFCPNVECLKLKSVTMNILTYQRLKSLFTNLTSLTLSGCSINDQQCSVLSNCSKLVYLDISDNYEITGKPLDTLPKLKSLNLCNCGNIQPTPFTALCEKTKLTELNIKRCDRLNKKSLGALLNTQTELEQLSITNTYTAGNLNDIAKLPSLKHLDIWSYKEISNDFFVELVTHKSQDLKILALSGPKLNMSQQESIFSMIGLEHLSIAKEVDDRFLSELYYRIPNLKKLSCSNCFQLTEEAVISYIVKAKHLETIDLSNCTQMTSSLIFNLIDGLKAANRLEPIHVVVGNTQISKSIESEPQFIENKHLLTLSYEATHLSFFLDDDDVYMSDDSYEDVLSYLYSSDYDEDDDDDDDNLFEYGESFEIDDYDDLDDAEGERILFCLLLNEMLH